MKTNKLHSAAAMIIGMLMLIAAAMPLSTMFFVGSASATTVDAYETPAGFNDNDYQKMLAFLEYVGSSGSSNGELLVGESYNPADPLSWLYVESYDWGDISWGVQWTQFDGEYYITAIDSNFIPLEGPVDLSNFLHIENISLFNCVSGDIDVSYCPVLSMVAITYGNAEVADLSGCSQLTHAYLFGNKLTDIIGLEDCGNMIYLSIGDNAELSQLDLSAFEHTLQYLFVDSTAIDSLNFENLWGILELGCSNTGITQIDVSACTSLSALDCKNNDLEYLILPEGDNNMQVDCSNTGLTELDITGCNGIYSLNCSNNPIEVLDFTNSPWIQFINAQNCALEILDISGCENLTSVDCRDNSISVLDVSAAKSLMQLYCTGNEIKEIYWHINDEWNPETIVSLNANDNGYIGIGFEMDETTFSAMNYFEATPEAGYKFVNWTDAEGNVVSTDSRFFFENQVNYEMYANFEVDDEAPELTPAPTEEPVPTEDPVDPTEPTPVPDTPSIPETGAIGLAGIGIVAVAAGATALFARKKD